MKEEYKCPVCGCTVQDRYDGIYKSEQATAREAGLWCCDKCRQGFAPLYFNPRNGKWWRGKTAMLKAVKEGTVETTDESTEEEQVPEYIKRMLGVD